MAIDKVGSQFRLKGIKLIRKTFKLSVAAVMFVVGVYVMLWGIPRDLPTNNRVADLKAEIAELEDRFGITVSFALGEEGLPDAWRSPPLSAEASPAAESCMRQWILLAKRELGSYRAPVIRSHVSTVHFFRDLTINGITYGGTIFEDELFLTLDCNGNYTESYIAKLIHHELSSVFMHASNFDTNTWSDLNPPGFEYMQSQKAIMASIDEDTEMTGSEYLFGQGLLADYSRTGVENDFNLYAEVALTEPGRLQELAERYPRIRQKTALLMKLYDGFLRHDTPTCDVFKCDA
ncbi:hypothetical protein ACMDCT_08080 [Halomonadaceae bacterium KBTZ08]